MANIKSAKKRILVAERNHDRNVAYKSKVKTAVKVVLADTAARKKSRLTKAVNKLLAE